ncbi:MAG TPA: isocitrate lyase [Steroidobacteraceae bacterium]|nr:isocitrate lyase [Steroidobacteraceae bacterium]
MIDLVKSAAQLTADWKANARWHGVRRPYSADEVVKLQGSVRIEHSLARLGSEKFWRELHEQPVIGALGCMSGNQAVQAVQAGLRAIYCSGWQVAGDANSAGEMYPDQSLYPVDSVPRMVERLNNALLRTDQIQTLAGKDAVDWLVPIVADAEAGFGGNLNAFELMKAMIRAGAAAVHFEDQLSSAKKCGHLGGKVLVSTEEAVNKLVAARLASDVLGVPTVLIARTDADAANLLLSDHDARDRSFLTGERSGEGFFYVKAGLDQAIARGLAYAPYADLIWCETSRPDLAQAKRFAEAIRREFPDKLLAYNCSPSFNWQANLGADSMQRWREELAAMGYRFQFITLAGWHALNMAMFELASAYREDGMLGYSRLQQREFAAEPAGYRAVKHQAFVGTGYFDAVQSVITAGRSSTIALAGSTETEQFAAQESDGGARRRAAG